MTTRSEVLTQAPAAQTTWPADARRALAAVVATDGSAAQTVARVALGAVMLPHGLQKAFGMFGGYGFEGTMGFLTGMGLPWLVALLVIGIELVGATALLAGAFGRVAALGVSSVMIGAVATTHLQHGFFMNWGGTAAGEGFEFHLLALGLAVVVMLRGSGAWSVDRWLGKLVA